jgi:hypothetical protein
MGHQQLICFLLTIKHDYFVSNLLSDIFVDNEQGAMVKLAEWCNGDNIDFFLPEDRNRFDAKQFLSIRDMATKVESTLSTDQVHCSIKLNIQYI